MKKKKSPYLHPNTKRKTSKKKPDGLKVKPISFSHYRNEADYAVFSDGIELLGGALPGKYGEMIEKNINNAAVNNARNGDMTTVDINMDTYCVKLHVATYDPRALAYKSLVEKDPELLVLLMEKRYAIPYDVSTYPVQINPIGLNFINVDGAVLFDGKRFSYKRQDSIEEYTTELHDQLIEFIGNHIHFPKPIRSKKLEWAYRTNFLRCELIAMLPEDIIDENKCRLHDTRLKKLCDIFLITENVKIRKRIDNLFSEIGLYFVMGAGIQYLTERCPYVSKHVGNGDTRFVITNPCGLTQEFISRAASLFEELQKGEM